MKIRPRPRIPARRDRILGTKDEGAVQFGGGGGGGGIFLQFDLGWVVGVGGPSGLCQILFEA